MGEAVRRLSEPFKQSHPEIPWAEIQGLRNIVVHEYDEVDLNIVWVTVTDDVPRVAAWVREYIGREGAGP